jgi:hypothetical protein
MDITISLDGGTTFKRVELKCPILFIIGDIKGFDALAGRYGAHKTGRISRICDCPIDEADNPKRKCVFNRVQTMKDLYALGETAENGLNSISQHYLKNAMHQVCFGGSILGVYGCTPMDLMHSLQHGIYMYIQQEIFKLLGDTQKCDVDVLVKALASRRQSVKRQYPRTDFTNGITNVSLKSSDEHSGCIFMLTLVLTMASVSTITDRFGGLDKLNRVRKILERLLCFEQWTKRETFWVMDDQSAQIAAEKAISDLLAALSKALPRTVGNGWQIPKFHEHLHLAHFINEFGTPRNFYASRCENHHIDVCKKPAKTAQRRHADFTMQVAERLADTHLITTATRKMSLGKTLPKTMQDLAHAATFLHSAVAEEEEEVTSDEEEDDMGDEEDTGGSAGASRFFLRNDDDECSSGVVRLYLHSRRTSKNQKARVFNEVPSELIEFLVATYYNGDCTLNMPKYADLEFVSEYIRDGIRFRGHWDYRSQGPWHDWVYVDWGVEGLVPAKILMFAKYTRVPDHGAPEGCSLVAYDAVIVSGKKKPRRNTMLTMRFKLDTTMIRRYHSGPSLIPTYRFVGCMAISGGCLVFPNDGSGPEDGSAPEDMLVIDPIQEWSDNFHTSDEW